MANFVAHLTILSLLIGKCLADGHRQLDVALVIDTSSFVGDNFATYTHSLRQFMMGLRVEEAGHRVAVVAYSTAPTVTLNLTDGNTTDRCLRAVDRIQATPGARNTHLALEAVSEQVFTPEGAGDRADAGNLLLLIITGSSYLQHDTLMAANRLKAAGVTIFSLGIGRRVSDAEIQFLASKPASSFSRRIRGLGELSDRLSAMAADRCSAEEETKVLECPPLFDIAFIVDASLSLSTEDFQMQKEFVDKLLSSFDISPQMSRAALVSFSNRSQIVFNLATYSSYSPMKAAILSVAQTGLGRVLPRAMRFCRNAIFRDRRLDDTDVPIPQILIIVSGGKSRYPRQVLEEATLLKQNGVTIFTISAGRHKDVLMSRIASSPPNRYNFNVLQFSDLDMVYSDMMNTTCSELAILSQKTIDEHFEFGTQLPTEGCQGQADIMFFFQIPEDEEKLETLRSYIETIVDHLEVDEGAIRVALTAMHGGCTPITTFHQNTTKNGTLTALRELDTSISAEGRGDSMHLFSRKSPIGWRDDVVKIVVFVHFDLNGISWRDVSNFVRTSHRQDIVRFVIDIEGTSTDIANHVASEPKSSHVIYAPYLDILMTTAPFLLSRICDEATPAAHILIW